MRDAIKHLDRSGCPVCGVLAPGALVVDEPVDVTCIGCLLWVSMQLAARLLKDPTPGGSK